MWTMYTAPSEGGKVCASLSLKPTPFDSFHDRPLDRGKPAVCTTKPGHIDRFDAIVALYESSERLLAVQPLDQDDTPITRCTVGTLDKGGRGPKSLECGLRQA